MNNPTEKQLILIKELEKDGPKFTGLTRQEASNYIQKELKIKKDALEYDQAAAQEIKEEFFYK